MKNKIILILKVILVIFTFYNCSLSDKNLKAILINIFGGIVRCDRVANGVVEAVKELGLDVPVVVRLEGTNSEEAKEILARSNLSIIPASDMKDAALKVVKSI